MTYDNRNIVNVYANRFRTEWTNTDLRIRFGEIMFTSNVVNTDDGDPSHSNRKLFVEERVGLTMTWLTAKELRDTLNELLAEYEKANGELVDGVTIEWKSKTTKTPSGPTEPPLEPPATESA